MKSVREKTIAFERCLQFRQGCKSEAEVRGLCRNHYQSLWEVIEVEGKGKWEEAQELGLILPPKRNAKQFYRDALEGKQKVN